MQLRTFALCVCAALAVLGSGEPTQTPLVASGKDEPGLVFSVKTWEGEYSSKDIPGGVESTPSVGAIYTIDFDGTGLKKIAQLGKNTDYPTFSPDGKWIYFQSNATGRSHVYCCRPDGSGVVNLTEGDRLGKQWKDAYGYALSRDGSRLLYTVHDGKSGRVALAKPDGSDPRLLFPRLGYTYMGGPAIGAARRLTHADPTRTA
jgi:WD40-like Beta Propeller Repeat